MKPAIKYISVAIILQLSLTAYGSVFQQTAFNIAKENLPDGNITLNTINEVPVNSEKDTSILLERDTSFMQINTKLKAAAFRLKEKAAMLEDYVAENGFNADYCFMIDMSIPSGKNRFFIYNIKKEVVESSALVSHGSGSYTVGCNDLLVFSNMPNSNATSLGKYKIGNAYYGKWGLSYKLYGLDSTNSKAYERAIVLHSDSYIPGKETYPRHIYESAGCPAVSPAFLADLNKYLKITTRPILMWIYN